MAWKNTFPALLVAVHSLVSGGRRLTWPGLNCFKVNFCLSHVRVAT